MVDFSMSEEHKSLIETARRFTRERIIPIAAECDRDSKFPMDVFKAAWEIGLVNPCIPDEYGGSGMGELENALITEQLAYGCAGIQTSITANQLARPEFIGVQPFLTPELIPILAQFLFEQRRLLNDPCL